MATRKARYSVLIWNDRTGLVRVFRMVGTIDDAVELAHKLLGPDNPNWQILSGHATVKEFVA